MKLYFDKLGIHASTVDVSFDGGSTFTTYNKSDLLSSSLNVPDDISSFSQIIIRGGGVEDTPWYETDSLINKTIKNKVSKVLIPNGVTRIESSTFYSCTRLASIFIPSSVTFIEKSAFTYSTGLTSINVDERNKDYSSEDGVVYNKDKTQLYLCPLGKRSVNIPNGVTSFSNGAFSECPYLTSIAIPNGANSISYCAFNSCRGLTSINIPSSVTSIGGQAFFYCTNLETINYLGTQEQWDAITKGSNWNYMCPKRMVINYNYQG